jgi:hypothetical protein
VYEGDRLLLQDKISELILFDNDSNYIRLHGKGSYTTADIEKMERTHLRDNITVRYLSLLWEELFRPGKSSQPEKEKIAGSAGGVSRGLPLVTAPRDNYLTSMDSLAFRWHPVPWGRKYVLQLQNVEGLLWKDCVAADTQLIVRFKDQLAYGKKYKWTIDIIGQSGRPQFGDSGNLTLVDEPTVLAQLTPLSADSLGGIISTLQRIERCENLGCTKRADELYRRLLTDFPHNSALHKLYWSFCRRNYLL